MIVFSICVEEFKGYCKSVGGYNFIFRGLMVLFWE